MKLWAKKVLPGFTLIEIIVVITIILIVSSFAAPTITAFLSNRKLKSITGRLARCLLQCRARAIIDHNNIYAIFLKDGIVVIGEMAGKFSFQKYFASKREGANMEIRLRFADMIIKFDSKSPKNLKGVKAEKKTGLPGLPEGNWLTRPVSAKEFLSNSAFKGNAIFLLFKSDGTIEFSSGSGPGDIFSLEYMQKPPRNADIIVDQIGGSKYLKGWIDVRATGNISQTISRGVLAEEGSKSKEKRS